MVLVFIGESPFGVGIALISKFEKPGMFGLLESKRSQTSSGGGTNKIVPDSGPVSRENRYAEKPLFLFVGVGNEFLHAYPAAGRIRLRRHFASKDKPTSALFSMFVALH
jgi:hypothetical protein